jgi:hypothetical protein
MPRIFDNINEHLLAALQQTMEQAHRADFCVGYFNLRGWRQLGDLVEKWSGGEDACCRVLVGMQSTPQEELRAALRVAGVPAELDQGTAARLKRRAAEEFREQMTLGAPTDADEQALRRLNAQLKARKVVVKLHLAYPLHAKLYLLYRHDYNNPVTGFLGSSNLTFAGLSKQGELNVDVLDQDSTRKLEDWFADRWDDRWSIDISNDLAEIIDTSWAREQMLPPYYIYLKMAYHLAQEARAGVSEYQVPATFRNEMFDFQKAATQIAAHHVMKRGGVVIGDVVGLGKTLMATALARLFQEDFGWETLIICPKNLTHMWEGYVHRYQLVARVLSSSLAQQRLPEMAPYRFVLIDESHNLRNREGQRYQAIQTYIERAQSHCALLTATPYNKTFLDLSAQLRLFTPEDRDLGIRPESLLRSVGEGEFQRRHQCGLRTLAAFEKSEHIDDWRDLMRLFLIRRTRSFIQANYAETDAANGRKYLIFSDGSRSYFPTRVPKTLAFPVNDRDPRDQYAILYREDMVHAINDLYLPRYGLGEYIHPRPGVPPTPAERALIEGLGRARKRLMGFCRTNLFKRLESGGPAFIQSLERHALRNFIFLHALEHGLPLPLGTQDAALLEDEAGDEDADALLVPLDDTEDVTRDEATRDEAPLVSLTAEEVYRRRAAEAYKLYRTQYAKRFKWLPSGLFIGDLRAHLLADAQAMLAALRRCGDWRPESDAKLNALADLLQKTHPREKVLIFTQFADTERYLTEQLTGRAVAGIAGVSGDSGNPTLTVYRFSPASNKQKDLIGAPRELRALITTDVLSEGQNLQDCSIVVNYDLPWAIIRLIQRAGRVDRIGQQAERILCYSFLPADGVERIIRLRARVRSRLQANAQVVGADEAFFEGDTSDEPLVNLYNEMAGIFDDADEGGEEDLASQAYEIWKQAILANPALEKQIEALPPIVYSARTHLNTTADPAGALVYLRTSDGADALARVDTAGKIVTQSPLKILRAAGCALTTPAAPRAQNHHDLTHAAIAHLAAEERSVGGGLGRPSSARHKVYIRLKDYATVNKKTLWEDPDLERAVDDIYRHPLKSKAITTLNRQFKLNASDADLARVVKLLREQGDLCIVEEDASEEESQLICSLGLV